MQWNAYMAKNKHKINIALGIIFLMTVPCYNDKNIFKSKYILGS